MAALYHEGYIYVIGGLNYTDKCLKKCERYHLAINKNELMAEEETHFDNKE